MHSGGLEVVVVNQELVVEADVSMSAPWPDELFQMKKEHSYLKSCDLKRNSLSSLPEPDIIDFICKEP